MESLAKAQALDRELRRGVNILARWRVASLLHSEPACIVEVRPHTIEVRTKTGELVLLPRAHSVRWSIEFGAFPLGADVD